MEPFGPCDQRGWFLLWIRWSPRQWLRNLNPDLTMKCSSFWDYLPQWRDTVTDSSDCAHTAIVWIHWDYGSFDHVHFPHICETSAMLLSSSTNCSPTEPPGTHRLNPADPPWSSFWQTQPPMVLVLNPAALFLNYVNLSNNKPLKATAPCFLVFSVPCHHRPRAQQRFQFMTVTNAANSSHFILMEKSDRIKGGGSSFHLTFDASDLNEISDKLTLVRFALAY